MLVIPLHQLLLDRTPQNADRPVRCRAAAALAFTSGIVFRIPGKRQQVAPVNGKGRIASGIGIVAGFVAADGIAPLPHSLVYLPDSTVFRILQTRPQIVIAHGIGVLETVYQCDVILKSVFAD